MAGVNEAQVRYSKGRTMSVAVQPNWHLSPLPFLPMRRFSVDEYHRMIEAAILDENDRVELLEGWIVAKMAHNPPHDSMIDLAYGALEAFLPAGWYIRTQSAITTDDSEPEPDLAVVLGPRGRYGNRHPGPADVAFVVEVSDSTLSQDRTFKGPLYARAGIVRYWIINIPDARVEVCTDPSGPDPAPAYRQRRDYGLNEAVPVLVAGQEIGHVAVRELFPTAPPDDEVQGDGQESA